MDNFNTKLLFRAQDKDTVQYISDLIGLQEVEEVRESIAYGAHEMRGGTSLNRIKQMHTLMLPSELRVAAPCEEAA